MYFGQKPEPEFPGSLRLAHVYEIPRIQEGCVASRGILATHRKPAFILKKDYKGKQRLTTIM